MAGLPVAPQPTTHDVTIVTTKKLARAKVYGVPAEEWGVARAARDIKNANYCFHDIVTKSESDYIDEGFDEDQIKGLETYTGNTDIETLARDSVQEHQFAASDSLNNAARIVRTTEHYIRMDYEGKGRADLYLVITGGAQGEVLKKDGKLCVYPIDVVPFAVWTPIPLPHRLFGRSIADVVMPIQREKTALKRGALDNLYLHNNPRVEVAEVNAGENTLDDLLISRQGGIVRTKTPGGLNWQVVPDITPSIYPMMQYIDAERESRTGMSKQSQGLDADALQNQSATAVAQVFSASQMRLKLIARQLAEGVKDIISLLHHTIRSHGEEQQTIRLRNSWVQVDPRNWKTRDDMTINVGLGSGGKAQQFAGMMAIANFQKELLMGGKVNLVDDSGLYNTGKELVKILGHKNVDAFLNDPTAKDPQTNQLLHPPQPPPPNPEMIKVQGQMQIEQTKAQNEAQQAQIKSAQDQQSAELDAFHQKLKLESDVQLAREKHELDAKLALIDAALKEKQDQRDQEMHQMEMAHKREIHAQTMQKTALDYGLKAHETKSKEETKTGVHKTAKAVKDLHGAFEKHTKQVEESSNAPIEIVRGKDGKAAAVKRGGKVMKVKRGKDGRAEGLQ